jgi:hypothetical protein
MKKWSRRYLRKAFEGKQAGRRWLASSKLFNLNGLLASLGGMPASPTCFLRLLFTVGFWCMVQVVVGDQPISFDTYCRYANTNRDELPLYL